MQHAVNPKAHSQVILLRLDVNVRCSLLRALGDDQVDDLHHRRVLLDLRQPSGRHGGPACLLEGADVAVDPGSKFVSLGDRVLDLRSHAQHGLDALPGQHLQLGEQCQVTRVDRCEFKLVLVHPNGQDDVFAGVRLGDQRERLALDPRPAEIDLRDIEMQAEHTGQGLFVDEPLREQDLSQWAALSLLLSQGRLQLFRGQQPALKQKLTKALFLAKPKPSGGLALHGAHATASRTGPSSRRRISVSASGVKRRCRPGVRNAG